MAADTSQSANADACFSVIIVACGPLATGGVVYAIAVSQPVQSWTVLRSHNDFEAISKTLLPMSSGEMPKCPEAPKQPASDLPAMIRVRNELQQWLSSVLMHQRIRESPSIRQFLTLGANTIPHHYEGISWTQFNAVIVPSVPGAGVSTPIDNASDQHASPSVQGSSSQLHVDDMDMDYMFLGEDDGGAPQTEENEEEEDFIPSASERYKQTDEAVADEDEMDIMQFAGEVEMIDDIGSLAQSLGASHLGRSLQLQAERNRAAGNGNNGKPSEGIGIKVGVVSQKGILSSGGIGNAMADAAVDKDTIGHMPSYKTPQSTPRLDSFKMLKVIGKGSFGKVFLVRENKTGEIYALKVLRKDNIIKRNQIEHTKTERSVLGYVKHPFIVGMNMAFQSKDKLYFVLDYCAGGELFFHLGRLGRFPEQRARFYAAEIVLAISYVHSLDIVYRDLKPENVLLDDKGHIRLTDFGLSKEGISNSSSGANSFCGTPEYLAPEILNRQGHGRAVDWWSLGALLYEMLTGLPPFYCQDRERLFEKIRRSELSYPATVTSSAKGLLKGLLTKDPIRRLGSGPEDAEEIKRHEFFVSIAWDKLFRGEVQPPWSPKIKSSLDTSQFDKEFTNMPVFSPQSMQRVHGFGATPNNTDNPFEGFTFTDQVFHGPAAKAGT